MTAAAKGGERRRGAAKVVLWTVIVLLALPLLLVVLVSLPPVSGFVARRLLPLVNDQLNGEIAVADIGGSLLGRLYLDGVTVRDPQGEVVIAAERVELDYGLRDLLRGRIMLGPVRLVRPMVRLVKSHPGEPYTLLQVFERRDTGGGAARSRVDLTIRSLELRDGTVFATIWREPADPQVESAQQLDTMRLEAVNLRLPLLHYALTPPDARRAVAEIGAARAWLVDADVELLELAGTATLRGDSLHIAVATIRLPRSHLSAEAWFITGSERRRFAARADVEELTAGDITGMISGASIPDEWTFAGSARAASRSSGAVVVASPNLRIGAAGGTLRGDVTAVGADDEWAAENSRLEVQAIQIAELLRAFGIRSTLRARVDGFITADGDTGTVDLGVAGLGGYGVPSTATGRIRASGSLDSMRVTARLAGAFGHAALGAHVRSDGELSIHGLDARLTRFDLAALDARLPESSLNARLAGDVTFGSLPRSGNLRLWIDSSTIRGAVIDTAVVVVHADGRLLTADSMRIHGSGVTITGAGTIGLQEDQTGDFTLTFDAPALDAVEPLVRAVARDSVPGLAGSLRLDLTASGSLSRPSFALSVDGRDIAVEAAPVVIETFAAAAAGRPDSLSWSARAALDDDEETVLHVGGAVAGKAIALDSLTLERNEATWALDQGAVVERRDGRIHIDRALLRRSPAFGEVTITGALPGTLEITATQVPLGDIVGDVDVDSLPLLDATVTGSAEGWSGTAALVFPDSRRPIADSLPLTLEFATNPLRGQLQARQLQLAQLAPLVPSVRDLEGQLDGSVTVERSGEAPRLDGRLDLAGGMFLLPSTGVTYHDMQVGLGFSGDVVSLEQFDVRTGSGRADLTGVIRMTELERPELDLTLRAREFLVMKRRDFLEAAVTGDLRLQGFPVGARLSGRATVVEGGVYLNEFLRPSGIDLSNPLYAQFVDTTVLVREELERGPVEMLADSLRLDGVTVNLGDHFWLRSPDANIQLSGELTVSSGAGSREPDAGEYELVGTLRTVRGTYRLVLAPGLSREFAVRDGTIQYFGAPPNEAKLDIHVDHALTTSLGEDITITAHITGSIEQPVLSLTSDVAPPLTETEIISYLVFGAPTVQAFLDDEEDAGDRRSVFEQSAQRLAGVLSGRIEAAVQEQLGLPVDYFRIKPGEVQSGLAGTELIFGTQLRIFGQPSYLRAGPRFCPREKILSLDHIGINLETRLSPEWGMAFSVEPVQGCEAVMAGTAARPFQLGLDVFWERR